MTVSTMHVNRVRNYCKRAVNSKYPILSRSSQTGVYQQEDVWRLIAENRERLLKKSQPSATIYLELKLHVTRKCSRTTWIRITRAVKSHIQITETKTQAKHTSLGMTLLDS